MNLNINKQYLSETRLNLLPLPDASLSKRRHYVLSVERGADPAARVGTRYVWRKLEQDFTQALSNEEHQSTKVQVHVSEDEG